MNSRICHTCVACDYHYVLDNLLPRLRLVYLLDFSILIVLNGSTFSKAYLLFSRNDMKYFSGGNEVSFNLSSHALRVAESRFWVTIWDIITSLWEPSISMAIKELTLLDSELTSSARSRADSLWIFLNSSCWCDLQQSFACFHIYEYLLEASKLSDSWR